MSLFHSSEFVGLHGLTMYVDGDAKLLLGPERGTYGGFEGCERMAQMEALLTYAPRACTIKLAPASHDLQLFSRSMNVLQRAGFAITHIDLNYDMRPTVLTFEDRCDHGARKKLAKCERAGYRSFKLQRSQWHEAYRLISENRECAGRKLALSWVSLVRLEQALPETHELYGTFNSERMIAAAITLKIRPDVRLIYAWGDAEKNEFAPTVSLCKEIYTHPGVLFGPEKIFTK